MVEMEIEKWKEFRRALRVEDQKAFDELINKVRLHVSAAGHATRPNPVEAMLLSMLLEQQKTLTRLQAELAELKK